MQQGIYGMASDWTGATQKAGKLRLGGAAVPGGSRPRGPGAEPGILIPRGIGIPGWRKSRLHVGGHRDPAAPADPDAARERHARCRRLCGAQRDSLRRGLGSGQIRAQSTCNARRRRAEGCGSTQRSAGGAHPRGGGSSPPSSSPSPPPRLPRAPAPAFRRPLELPARPAMTNLHSAAPQAPAPPPPVQSALFRVRRRIAVLGARQVGKSALSIRLALNRFEPDYLQTFQDMYQWQPMVDGVHYDVSIDDTDGQDENSEFGLHYTTGVDGYVLVFSVRDQVSFQVAKALNDKLLDTLNVMQRKGVSEVPRVLVGNQIDVTGERKVPRHVAQSWADAEGIPYIESSAFTPYNTEEIFISVLRIVHQNWQDSLVVQPTPPESTVDQPPKTPNNFCSVQ